MSSAPKGITRDVALVVAPLWLSHWSGRGLWQIELAVWPVMLAFLVVGVALSKAFVWSRLYVSLVRAWPVAD